MTITYDAIATTTLGSNQSSVTFSSISGSFTDLVLIAQGSTTANEGIGLRFNGDTGTNYSNTYMIGNGTTASSNRDSNDNIGYVGYFSTGQSNVIANIMNYSNTTTFKTALGRGNPTNLVIARVALWRSTAAITSITVLPGSGNLVSGSTFTLYGIKAE